MRVTLYMRSGNVVSFEAKSIKTRRSASHDGLSHVEWTSKGRGASLHTVDPGQVEAVRIWKNWRGK